jgi:DNA-binding NtrC family response regulator
MSIEHFPERSNGEKIFKYPALVNAAEIVLIDDDEISNQINKRLLTNTFPDKNVRVFTGIDAAAEFFHSADDTPRFIFLDLNFPASQTGFDFLDKCQETELHSPVIILTASIDPEDPKNGEKYENVLAFLYKPLLVELLMVRK